MANLKKTKNMKKHTILPLILIIVFAFSACKNDETTNENENIYPEKSEIVGLASPIILNTFEENIVELKDFFPNLKSADEIELKVINDNLEINPDGTKLKIKVTSENLPKLSTISLKINGFFYDLILKKSNKAKHTFEYQFEENYETVQIKGEFNSWNPQNTVLEKNGDTWTGSIIADAGKYQYVLMVDGKEMLDPNNPEKTSNGFGGHNSVLQIGEKPTENPLEIFTISEGGDEIKFGFNHEPKTVLAFYQNHKLEAVNSVEGFTQPITIIIPKDAKQKERTYIRVFAFDDKSVANELLIPLHNGEVLTEISDLQRTDFEAATIYNTFIDRFFDGDPTNNRPTDDPDIHPRANYHGGDIAGITQKIEDDFFKELGINTIWISPIVKNPEGAYGEYPNPKTKFSAYHGYWPISFTLIDNRFGTEEEFTKLVETAHANNMNVLLDFVANHVHEEHPIYQANKDWATELHLPDGTLNTERWDEHRLTTWFDVFLPTLDLEKPEVYEMLTDSAVYWIEKYNLDGFRHDATKHIPEIFWQTLTLKLKQRVMIPQNKKLYQIGETYGTAELIGSYVNTGQLNAQFDFNVYDAVSTCLATDRNFADLAQVLQTSAKYYGNHHLMGNITGNQDRGRFISYAGGSLDFSEDAKLAGWTRKIEVGNPIGYKKSAMLMAVISTIPGIPVVYYGDEIGMPGGNDPDNRRMMKFENLTDEEKKLKENATKLLNFRQNSLALIFGDFKILQADNEIFVYQRTYFDKIVIVALNKSEEEKTIEIPISDRFNIENINANFGNEISKAENSINITISATSFEILSN